MKQKTDFVFFFYQCPFDSSDVGQKYPFICHPNTNAIFITFYRIFMTIWKNSCTAFHKQRLCLQ